MTVSWRASRRYQSAALESNALHFGGDLAGSLAVLVGSDPGAGLRTRDSVAALFVAVLVLAAAARLMRANIDVLMDRVPAEAEATARAAIAGLAPSSTCGGSGCARRRPQVRGRRHRRVAGRRRSARGTPPPTRRGGGQAALPGSDVVVHVEPLEIEGVRERVQAAALTVPGVREIHNVASSTWTDASRRRCTSSCPAT